MNHDPQVQVHTDQVGCVATTIEELQKQLKRERRRADFYKQRCSLLEKHQSGMREPERTLVCDILANGMLLTAADGTPLKSRYQTVTDPEIGAVQVRAYRLGYEAARCAGLSEDTSIAAGLGRALEQYNAPSRTPE